MEFEKYPYIRQIFFIIPSVTSTENVVNKISLNRRFKKLFLFGKFKIKYILNINILKHLCAIP